MSPEDEKQKKILTVKRGKIKAKLTRFSSYLDSFKEDDDIKELEERLSNIRSCLQEFESVQEELDLLLDLSDTQSQTQTSHLSEQEDFETHYFKAISKAKHLINLQTQDDTTDNSNTNSVSNSHIMASVKLSTINLPTFSGKFEEWMPFSDSFHSLIDKNDQLSAVQKLQYLKGALKGQASDVLKNLDITAANYEVGLELLKKQFYNKRLIVKQHVKAILELPHTARDNADSIRQLVTSALTHLRALEALQIKTENWDPILVHVITSRLDPSTHKDWELSSNSDSDQLPKFESLTDYLLKRSQSLVSVSTSHVRTPSHAEQPSQSSFRNKFYKQKHINTKTHLARNHSKCSLCGGNHQIFQCKELTSGSQDDLLTKLHKAKICVNCLKQGHILDQCKSSGCRKCHEKHNTLIHPRNINPSTDSNKNQQLAVSSKSFLTSTPKGISKGLLNTAIVKITGPTGITLNCRALLDSGSECCYVTEQVAQHLGLKRTKQNIQVSGVSQTVHHIKAISEATVSSCVTNFNRRLQLLIISKITETIPSDNLDLKDFKIPKHITLADPSFKKTGKIDLLIGQEMFWDLICIGQIRTPGLPTLQKTKLGWVVGGTITSEQGSVTDSTICNLTTLEKQLQKFWTLEEPMQRHHLTAEEASCEELFMATTRRQEDGRYVVKMPMKIDTSELGDSREMAERRFKQVEKRLIRDPGLNKQYSDFMTEYERLGHMELVKENANSHKTPEYYLPHHPVLKASSTTTKLRVVFDASAKSSSGKSLNNLQMVGPTVQSDIFSIITRFRMHKYVMTADLEKMYRQVLIDEEQRSLLKIIWRSSTDEPLHTYRLNTVTYGTASAPYLATRSLIQLAHDEETSFPEAARVVRNDFYVDDLLTGVDNVQQGKELQTQLIKLLSSGGFHLRKWNSNCSELLYSLPEQMRERQPQQVFGEEDASIKTLGLWWDAEEDTFQFRYTPVQRKHPVHLSKRIVLSDIARLFDPLGLIAPVIVRPKLLLQELWKLKLDWDESVPMHIHTQWMSIQRCLQDLSDIRIPRQVTHRSVQGSLNIHGFSDSSEKAYGCAIYLRHEDTNGVVKTSLLSSKSRVAPLHSTSLPRLELCAALLLTDVVTQLQNALQIPPGNTTYWTDSTVTLAWIRGEPARWTTFVANRVAKIQEASKNSSWRHVTTDFNPADLVSRGETARNLATSQLWWQGPSWLSKPKELWPDNIQDLKEIPEQKRITTSLLVSTQEPMNFFHGLINRFSSYNKLTHVISYMLRFIMNLSPMKKNKSGPLSIQELQEAEKTLIKYVQSVSFPEELKNLKHQKPVNKNSKLITLSPFLDEDGLIKVGGRLHHSDLTYDNRHPILLPKNHKVAEMIAAQEHLRNLHCGPQALLYAIRSKFWPLNGRDLVRKVTHQCLKCVRARPKTLEQKMGDLPASRVTPSRPFTHTGIDFSGPFLVKQSRRRGTRPTKAYVAVFVCLATKAVHLEIVSDLTTDTFLGALRRFVSRRGICAEIISDNGKTFVGANRKLQELCTFLKNESNNIINEAAKEGIKWSFNPPYAPHMGGIWEAAVKSFKHHLYRILGIANITYEEFNTSLIQIEAVLNSRPLTALSNDPSDLSALTPSHFLIGGSLKALPEPSVIDIPENRLSRWQRVQQLVQHFWSRWSKEYLTTLQQRSKWTTASTPLQVGSLVLLKDDHLPPLSWPMGRVTHLHPGQDSIPRVVTVSTARGSQKRSVNKLCLLPVEG